MENIKIRKPAAWENKEISPMLAFIFTLMENLHHNADDYVDVVVVFVIISIVLVLVLSIDGCLDTTDTYWQ